MVDVAQGFDYVVVVGGGTAGCALSARLSEDSRRTVCLLEAGGSGKSVFVNVPGALVVAQREIVLTAGAIHSPQLLMLSGIGDGEHLATLGLEVRHDLPGVGRNLHYHLASPVHMRTRNPVSYGVSLRAMPRNLLNVAEYLLFRRGPLANNVFESAAFVKSIPGLDKPDLQLVFQPAKRPDPSFPYPVGHGFAISPVGLYPRSRGRVTLASPDPFDAPLIDPNALSAPEDLLPLIRGIRLARKIFASTAFATTIEATRTLS
jgi:choline dehydrogenase